MMSNTKFNAKHRVILRHDAFTPIAFTLKGQKYSIQFNHCTNPFCRWYGDDQSELRRINVRGKRRYKYKLNGQPFIDGDRRIVCNEDSLTPGASGGCGTRPISTWSVAEEIKRLVTLNTVLDLEPDYKFHKEVCDFEGAPRLMAQNPFTLTVKVKQIPNGLNASRVAKSRTSCRKENRPTVITNSAMRFCPH